MITQSVIDGGWAFHHAPIVLSKSELLAKVEDAAGSRAEIARLLGLAPARITELYKGERDLSFDEGRRLIAHYKIDDLGTTDPIADFAAEYGISFIEEVDLSLGLGGGTFEAHVESKGVVPFKADWLHGLNAGPNEHLRVVRGEGDSMQPTILDGDLVLIDTSQRRISSQDRIWAVFWGELGMIKRVRSAPHGRIHLLSDNPAVSMIEAVEDELSILGRVIWIGRRM